MPAVLRNDTVGDFEETPVSADFFAPFCFEHLKQTAQDLTQLPGTPRDADLSVLPGSDAELEAPQLTQSVREELQSTASRIDVLLPGSGEVLTNLLRGKGFGKGPGARYSPA